MEVKFINKIILEVVIYSKIILKFSFLLTKEELNKSFQSFQANIIIFFFFFNSNKLAV